MSALRLTRSTIQRLWLLAIIVVASAAAGGLYSVIRAPRDFNWIVVVATGATIGAVISLCVIGFELFVAGSLFERGGRRLPLMTAMLVRMIVYGVVIISALLAFPWLYSVRNPTCSGGALSATSCFRLLQHLYSSLMSIAQVIGPKVLGSL